MDAKIIICRGLPASGKTTWAKDQCKKHSEYVRVNKDDLREMYHAGVYSKDNEREIIIIRDVIIHGAIDARKTIIIDDCNLNPKHLKNIERIRSSKLDNIKIELKDFTDIPISVCIERDSERAKPVGRDVIRNMVNNYKNIIWKE